MFRRTIRGVAIVWAAIAVAVPELSIAQSPKPTLHIVVVAGEDAVNVIQQRTAVAPVVEVRDQNNQPVAGAVVRFVVRGKAAFFSGANTASTTTNAVGQATVSQFTATGAGTVRIDVVATFQGQSASATITQTNFATAAQAASSANPSQGGGGGLGAGTIVGIAAAAAGVAGYVYYDKVLDAPFQPAFTCAGSSEVFRTNPQQAVVGQTIFLDYGSCLAWEIGRTTFTINWGDGETFNGNPDDFNNTHVYRSAGTFTIRMTITDKSGLNAFRETTVTIRSLTATWLSDDGILTLVQDGVSLKGAYTPRSGAGVVMVSGRLSETADPQLILNAGASTFSGRALAADTFSWAISNGQTLTFRRQ